MDTNGVLDLTKKRFRRSWSAEEKRSICLQTLAPGVSVAQVARRYVMNANLILKWLKDPAFFSQTKLEIEGIGRFCPVEIFYWSLKAHFANLFPQSNGRETEDLIISPVPGPRAIWRINNLAGKGPPAPGTG